MGTTRGFTSSPFRVYHILMAARSTYCLYHNIKAACQPKSPLAHLIVFAINNYYQNNYHHLVFPVDEGRFKKKYAGTSW